MTAPHSRIYWSIWTDSKFDGIRENDSHLATWTRLLLLADMAYPAPASIPVNCRKASVKALAAAELIDLLPGHLFRVHGLEAERRRRSDAGRIAAASRWQSDSDADGDASRNANALLDKGIGIGKDRDRYGSTEAVPTWRGREAAVEPESKAS